MLDTVVGHTITATLPGTDPSVENHHNEAKAAIAAMSRSRQWGAETNLRSWRRWIKSIDPACTTGWGFRGIELKPGADATFPVGAIIVSSDISWAKARWYAGSYIQPMEVAAALYVVTSDGLVELTRSVRRAWARDLLGWLATNRREMPITKAGGPILRRAM
ncbi:MAG: hypothetical protein ACREEK_22665 [Bradyrhizobium sp.]